MIRPKLSLRRSLAVLGATFIGLTGALAVAGPASAHHTMLEGHFNCDVKTGNYVGYWKMTADAPAPQYRLDTVVSKRYVGGQATDLPLEKIKTGKFDGKDYPYDTNKPVTENLTLPGNTTKVYLHIAATWNNDQHDSQKPEKTISLSGNCEARTPVPTADVDAKCDDKTVVVSLHNAEEATAPAHFTVKVGDKKTPYTVKPGETKPVEVPVGSHITVTAQGQDKPLYDDTPAPANCTTPEEATIVFEVTCDKLIFTAENPEGGKTVTAIFTPNKGEEQKVTVEPGKSVPVEFTGEAGLVVTPAIEGSKPIKAVSWDEQKSEADCAAAPGGGGGGDETLPLTGPAVGAIAGGAALVLAVGAVLFVMARRRRIRFTA